MGDFEQRPRLVGHGVPLVGVGAVAAFNGTLFSPIFDSVFYYLDTFARGSLFYSPELYLNATSVFMSLMTLLIAGIPAAIYERTRGLKMSSQPFACVRDCTPCSTETRAACQRVCMTRERRADRRGSATCCRASQSGCSSEPDREDRRSAFGSASSPWRWRRDGESQGHSASGSRRPAGQEHRRTRLGRSGQSLVK